MSRQRRTNRNVRSVVLNHLKGCVHGTRINSTALARQLSDRDRVFLAGTVAGILGECINLRSNKVNEFIVI